jgi:hypothetical protein
MALFLLIGVAAPAVLAVTDGKNSKPVVSETLFHFEY